MTTTTTTTTTTTEAMTITPANRDLSFGWDNKPVRRYAPHGSGSLGFDAPAAPKTQGGLSVLRRQMAECRRINSGNHYSKAFFVDGKRVVSGADQIEMMLTATRDKNCPVYLRYADVEVEA